jgi:hypothetical protein
MYPILVPTTLCTKTSIIETCNNFKLRLENTDDYFIELKGTSVPCVRFFNATPLGTMCSQNPLKYMGRAIKLYLPPWR